MRPTLVALSLLLSACGSASPPGQLDEDGNECPLTAPRGDVTLVAYASNGWNGMDVTGRFQRSVPAREAATCQRRTVGACEINACRNLGIDFVNGEPTCGPTSAGALLLSRGAATPTRVEGSARLTVDRALVPGETFSLRTTGGDVPSFSATINLPQRVTVTAPDPLTRNGDLRVAPGASFTVAWTPTTSRVIVVVTASNGGDYTAECAFDGAAGTATIPAAALPEETAHVAVWTEERTEQRVGVFPVVVRARWGTPTGATLTRGE